MAKNTNIRMEKVKYNKDNLENENLQFNPISTDS